jgi:hypothetical protein
MSEPSSNLDRVKRYVLGPGQHPNDVHVSHDATVHKLDDRSQLVSELLDANVVIHIPASMPYGGDHVGHEGFKAVSDAMNATWRITDGLEMSFVDFRSDQVICLVSWLGESLHTGRSVPMRMVEFFRLVDGKIAEVTLFYWDTAEIVEATGGAKTITPEHFGVPALL